MINRPWPGFVVDAFIQILLKPGASGMWPIAHRAVY